MASIQTSVQEFKEINIEIKRLQKIVSDLKKRSVLLKKNIVSYLNEKEQPGVKYQNTAILLENKAKRIKKSKKDIESESIRLLEESGISDAKGLLNKLLESRRGDKVEVQEIKIKKI